MGAVPPVRPFRPNLDRFGLPRDFETYIWATYGPGREIPPERRAFLYDPAAVPRMVVSYGLLSAEALADFDPRVAEMR